MDLLIGIKDYILPFLVILGIVVFVHELGHYLVARRNGVRVEVFSIGFGRELFGFNDRHGTRWKVSLIPLGGYVKMLGYSDTTGPEDRPLTPEEEAQSFRAKGVAQRAAIIAGGPFANFVFAILVLAGVFMTVGQPVTPPVVGDVVKGSAAEAAGFQPGDRVVAMGGQAVDRFADIQRLVRLGSGAPTAVVVERAGQRVTLSVMPRISEHTDNFGNVQRMPMLGISVSATEQVMVRHNPLSAVGEAFGQTYDVVHATVIAMGQMIAGTRGAEELGGPLRIAQFSGQAAQMGLVNFITFIAILSINLGLINLFPIPLLDGGHLVFCGLEAALGRPLGEAAQEFGLRIGLVLVFGLMVFATWNDLVQLKVWDYFIRLVS